MNPETIQEEEYSVGNPVEFIHQRVSCMSSCEPMGIDEAPDAILMYEDQGKTALSIDGVVVLIDEAP